MKNLSPNSQIYLHKNSDILQIASESKITLYQLSLPRITHQFVNGREGTVQNVTISAQSKWANSTLGEKCQVKYQLKIVSNNDQIVLKSNYPTSKKYFKNNAWRYESRSVQIDLNNYFYGTNISYGISNIAKSNSPSNFIEKINQRVLLIPKTVKGQTTFMKISQQFFSYSHYLFSMYVQTSDDILYWLKCEQSTGKNSQYCEIQKIFQKVGSPVRFLVSFDAYRFAVTSQNKKNQIVIHQYSKNPDIFIEYDINKTVKGMVFSNEHLYVLKDADSVIDVYQCNNNKNPCDIKFQIDITNLSKSQSHAQDILSYKSHPSVLFLKYPKSILVIDSSRSAANVLIAEIQTKQTSSSSFNFLVSNNKLIIVSSSNTISVYSLDLLKQGQVTEEKKLPLYGNSLHSIKNVICANQFLYVPTVNPKNNSTSIFIYKLNTPATLSLYVSFDLPKNFSSSKLQMSVNYLTNDRLIITNGFQNLFYEIFYKPKAVFTEDINQKFQLTFSNSYSNISQTSQTCEIEAISNNLEFNKTKEFDSFVKEVKLDKPGTYPWNDRKWFEGNILDYNFTCEQCNDTPDAKISFRSHNGELKLFDNVYKAFFETSLGSIYLKDKTLFKLNRDFTLRQKITLLNQKQKFNLQQVLSTSSEDVIVTILTQSFSDSFVNLIFTTKVGNESKASQIFQTAARNCQKTQIVGDLLMLQDYIAYNRFNKKESIYLFDIKMKRIIKTQKYDLMEEVEVICQNYLKNVLGYNRDQVWISGSHLIQLETNNYRLYIAQTKGGLFIIDFSYKIGQKELNIIKMSFEDLNVVIQQNNLALPSDAYANSLNFISSLITNDTMTHSLLITYNRFHNLIFSIQFDRNNRIVKKELKSLLQRYDNYTTTAYVQVILSGDFVGIYYYQDEDFSFQQNFVAIYDISNFSSGEEGSYSKKYILTSVQSKMFCQITGFTFNKTQIEVSNGKSVGFIYWIQCDKGMKELKIYKNLQLTLKPGYKADNFTLIPWKYGKAENISLPITTRTSFPYNFLKGNLHKQTLFDQ